MKKTIISLVFFITLASLKLNAQSKHAIYFEALGNGIVYSVNYDLRLGNEVAGWGARIGVGYTPFSDSNLLTLPAMVNYLFGSQRHFLEIGAGAVFFNGDAHFVGDYTYDKSLGATANVSYRYQAIENGLFFKAGLTPIFTDDFNSSLWVGLAFGYSF